MTATVRSRKTRKTDKSSNAHMLEKIRDLDLEPIEARLRFREGWSEKRTKNAIEEYRRFLFLLGSKSVPDQFRRPPNGDVDEVWHCHIIHTEKYGRDCMQIAGRMIHHRPDPPPIPATAKRKRKSEKRDVYCGACCGG